MLCAMFFLDKSLAYSINMQVSKFEIKYLIEWTFIILLSFLPLFLVSFYENKKLKILISIYRNQFLFCT